MTARTSLAVEWADASIALAVITLAGLLVLVVVWQLLKMARDSANDRRSGPNDIERHAR